MSYVQNTEKDKREMLESIGVPTIEALLEAIDPALRVEGGLRIDPAQPEPAVADFFERLAGGNRPASAAASFLGGGIYDRFIPATVRYVVSRSEFYTAYTPYQAEVSQGTLQAIYEYQSLISRLTGMDAANASMYDGATALAEAMLMACSIKRKSRILVPRALSARTREVLRSYAVGKGIAVDEVASAGDGLMDLDLLGEMCDDGVAAVVVAQPNYFGLIEHAGRVSELAHGKGALLVAYVDPVSLAVLEPPGEYDADIAVGEGQQLGNPQNFGGPLLGFMATKQAYIRKCPGRLISSTVDVDGNRGYVMTLQTREQHIRREKATSNICTNEGLCALAAAVYLASLGESGLREVAVQSMSKAHTLYRMLDAVDGVALPFGDRFFQEFVVRIPGDLRRFLSSAGEQDVLAGIPLDGDFPELGGNALLVAVTEKRTRKELSLYRDIAAGKGGRS